MEQNKLLKLGLQYFADEQNNNGEEENNGDQTPDNSGEDSKDESKSYTNEELQKMMAKEKKQGKSAGKTELMKELGIDDLTKFKANLEEFKKYQEKQKSDLDKKTDEVNNVTKEKEEALNRALIAESKLNAIKLGVKANYVDDVIAIALTKVDDENTLDDVIEEMKKTHEFYFDKPNDSNGTGTNPGNKKVPTKPEGIGARLAKARETNASKSSYFSTK